MLRFREVKTQHVAVCFLLVLGPVCLSTAPSRHPGLLIHGTKAGSAVAQRSLFCAATPCSCTKVADYDLPRYATEQANTFAHRGLSSTMPCSLRTSLRMVCPHVYANRFANEIAKMLLIPTVTCRTCHCSFEHGIFNLRRSHVMISHYCARNHSFVLIHVVRKWLWHNISHEEGCATVSRLCIDGSRVCMINMMNSRLLATPSANTHLRYMLEDITNSKHKTSNAKQTNNLAMSVTHSNN